MHRVLPILNPGPGPGSDPDPDPGPDTLSSSTASILTLTLTPTPTLTAAHLSAPPSAADTFRLEGDNTLIMSNVTTLEDGRSATYSQVYYRKGTKPTKPE